MCFCESVIENECHCFELLSSKFVCAHVRFFSELAGPLGPTETDQEPAVPSQPVEIEIETAEARHKRQKKCVFGK